MIRLPFLGRRDGRVDRLYAAIMTAAREPEIYRDFGVRDDFEGRFEVFTLVATLVLRRMKQLPGPADEAAQALVDRIFDGIDDSFRRIGIGDLSVGKKVKKLAQGFYGRAEAYSQALESGDDAALRDVLARNLFGGMIEAGSVADGLVRRIGMWRSRLDSAGLAELLAGEPFSGGDCRAGGQESTGEEGTGLR